MVAVVTWEAVLEEIGSSARYWADVLATALADYDSLYRSGWPLEKTGTPSSQGWRSSNFMPMARCLTARWAGAAG